VSQDKDAAERSAHVARPSPIVPQVRNDRHLWPWFTVQVFHAGTGAILRQWDFQMEPHHAESLDAQIVKGKAKW
jgi:hypothetical protein